MIKGRLMSLNDVAEWGSGGTPKRGVHEYFGEGMPWLSVSDLNDDVVTTAKESLTASGIEHSSAKVVPEGTVFIAMYASIGKLGIAGQPCCTSQAIAFAKPDTSIIDRWYLFYFLQAQREKFKSISNTGTQPNISQKILKAWPITVPDMTTQCRVVNRLDAVRHQIRLLESMLAKTDELVQSRFVEMFEDPSRERVTLADVCDFYSGGTPSKRKPEYWNGTLPWFSPKDMKRPVLDDSIDHISDTVVEQTSLRLLPSDTVVIVVRGMILAHDVPVSIITVPATINQDMKALIPKPGKECDSVYLAAAIRSQENYLLAETGSSAHGTKKIDATVLEAVSIPEADIHEQREFAAFIRQIESLKTALNRQLDRLNTLYDSLTQRYFA